MWAGWQFITQEEEWTWIYRLNKNILEIFYHHLKVLSWLGWKHHTDPTPTPNLFLSSTWRIFFNFCKRLTASLFLLWGFCTESFSSAGPPPRDSLGSPTQSQILRSISHISGLHSACGSTAKSFVSFLHFLHKEILSSKALSKVPLKSLFLHDFLAQPSSQKKEGTFQELGRNVHPSLPPYPSHEPLVPQRHPYTSRRPTRSSEPGTQ